MGTNAGAQDAFIDTAVSHLLEHLAAGDADGIAHLFAANIDWIVPGNPALPWVGRRSEQREVADYFRTMWPRFTPGRSSTELKQILTAGDDAVIFANFTHTAARTGREWRTPVAMHVKVDSDGRLIKLHLYEDTWAVSNAFFPETGA